MKCTYGDTRGQVGVKLQIQGAESHFDQLSLQIKMMCRITHGWDEKSTLKHAPIDPQI
jgi:hypothetical protein